MADFNPLPSAAQARLTRRRFLLASLGLGAAAGLAAACTPAAPPQPTAAPAKAGPPQADKPAESKPAGPTAAAAKPADAKPAEAKPTQAAPATKPAEAAKPAAQKQIVVGTTGELNLLDPHLTSSRLGQVVLENIFDALTARDDKLNIRPALAESWTPSADGKSWRVVLRKGAKFHNGEPVTAADVKYSIERVKDPNAKSQFAANLKPISEVAVIDPGTVEIRTAEPMPLLPAEMYGVIRVVPARYAQEKGYQEFGRAPIGAGAYKLVEWVKDDRLVLQANPDYWGGKPKIDRVIIRPIPEPSTRLAELLAGKVDIIASVEEQQVPTIERSGQAAVQRVTSSREMHLGMRIDQKPFDDLRVRQAINHAVDVDGIVKGLMAGYATRLYGLVPPVAFGHIPDLKPYPYDVAKARALMAQAGLSGGISTRLDTPVGRYPKDIEMSQVVAAQLGEIGIKVEIVQNEWNAYQEKYQRRQHEPIFLRSIGGGGNFDADTYLYLQAQSQQYRSYVKDAEFDALLEQARTSVEPQKRLDVYRKAQQRLLDQAYFVPFFALEDLYGVSKRVTWKARADEAIWMFEADVQA